jgi:hypothetical protein
LGCVLKNPPISVFSDASDIRIIISIAQVLHNCALNLMIALWGRKFLVVLLQWRSSTFWQNYI